DLGVGSVASFTTSQLVYTSAPISLLVLLNLANRSRFEQSMQNQVGVAIDEIEKRLSMHVELLNQQIGSLPTPEMMGSLKKSMLVKSREASEAFAADLKTLQQDLQIRLDALEAGDLGSVRGEVRRLRDQYSQLCDDMVHITERLHDLSSSRQVEDLETAIAQIRSDTAHLKTNLQVLSDQTRPALNTLQEQINRLNRQFQALPPPFDASTLRQEVSELIRMVSDLVPRRDWTALVTEMQSLYEQQDSQARAEELLRRKVQDLTQQLRDQPSRETLHSLQQQVNTLSQQVANLPPPFDPTSLRREIARLLRVVGDLVPQRDFSGLVRQVRALQRQQEFQMQVEQALQAELRVISQQLQDLIAENRAETSDRPPALASSAAPAETAETAETTETAEALFKAQVEAMLRQELQRISQQLQALPTGGTFQMQIEATVLGVLQELNQHLRTYPTGPRYEFVLDFRGGPSAEADAATALHPALYDDFTAAALLDVPSSRLVLEQALDTTGDRLLVTLPWSSQCPIDRPMVRRLHDFLAQGRQLAIGWCYSADQDLPRFLSAMVQRWHTTSQQARSLQETLQNLLELKRQFPSQFQFKILGTRENFLVSDDRYAVLGLDESLVNDLGIPHLELKLRTSDPATVQQLTQRFENPVLHPTDVQSHWNRAVTRYELGDPQGALSDVEQILRIRPDQALAWNLRGLCHDDLGERQQAIADFSTALQLDRNQMDAHCNRGYLRSEQGDLIGAIADFTNALTIQPNCAMIYFFRGLAAQRLGEIKSAFRDYAAAIQLAPDVPTPYYYRGLARSGNPAGAIADLQQALELFAQQGNETNARKVFSHLQRLTKTRQGTPSVLDPDAVPDAAPIPVAIAFEEN
ncbi:MAG: tetratricopeptide repeat protein, partial [Cyanobacteriota bacterium]